MKYRTKFINRSFFFAIICLVTGLLLDYFLVHWIQNEHRYTNEIAANIGKEIKVAEKDLANVRSAVANNQELRFANLDLEKKYPYYLYKNGKLQFWSDNRLVPEYGDLSGNYAYKLIYLPQGHYISIRELIRNSDGESELYILIPLYFKSSINNQYLQSGYNKEIIKGTDLVIFADPEVGIPVFAGKDQFLFSITYGDDYKLENHFIHYIVFFILLIGLIFTLRWITFLIRWFMKKHKYLEGFIFLIFSLFSLRIIMLLTQFPFTIVNMELFDSAKFASSALNPSLGDLFLNGVSVLTCIVFFFNHYNKFNIYRQLKRLDDKLKWIISWALMFGSYFFLLGVYEGMMNMQKHAQWSIDISQSIDFSSPLKWLSLLIYFMAVVGYFSLSHVVIKTLSKLIKKPSIMHLYLLSCMIIFMSFAFISKWPFVLLAIVHTGYFLLVYHLSLTRNIKQISYLTFIYFFIASITCATIGSYTIYKFSKTKNLSIKQNIAAQLLAEEDILAEYLLNEAISSIGNDFFIATTFSNYFTGKDVINQKIRRRHLNNYLDRYEIDIYLFDQRGVPITESGYIENYYQFREKYAKPENETEYENIFSIKSIDSDLENGYMVFIPIYHRKFKSNAGFVILELRLKRLIPNSVYPELLVDNNQAQLNQQKDFGYAIYRNNKVEYSSGLFDVRKDFTTDAFNEEDIYKTGIIKGKTMFLALKGENQRTIVVSSPRYRFKNILANFSFLFLLLIFVILLIIIFYSIKFEFKGINLNLAAKIQLYLNVAFFLPLFAISITTLSLLSSSYKNQLMNDYFEKAEKISANVSPLLVSYFNNMVSREMLSNKLAEIAKYAESDLNFFNVKGELIASTQPLIYENNLLSTYSHPAAVEAVVVNNDRILIDESVGSLNFKDTYYGVKSFETGQIISILSIPFFESETERDNQMIEVLSNIIVTFTFIFILFLALSYFASIVLTKPLRYITQKIKKISLSDTNTPMVWNSDDEIGLLVGEYNKMLINLEESKKALARSEKESAWREMAKQVAHEIKNPLTPMKLNLQHLKRRMGINGERESDEHTRKAINNLLHQIDTLSDIATSFSAFAQMPIPKNERIELTKVVKEAAQLHANDKEIAMETKFADGPLYVIGDEKLLGRIINNLILNGLQSVAPGVTPEIVVGLTTKDNKAIIEVRDNGIGINEDIAEKVFIPNFSTKDTGTGIGLAISKRGIEQVGGSIWFDSEKGKGTSFYIELPLVN